MDLMLSLNNDIIISFSKTERMSRDSYSSFCSLSDARFADSNRVNKQLSSLCLKISHLDKKKKTLLTVDDV